MVTELDTDALRALIGDAQLVDVQSVDDFEEEHLPGAVRADDDRDLQDDRAHRTAARLEADGFTDVRVYPHGIHAWLAEGLPSEGLRRPEQRVAAIARTDDVPTLAAGATLADAAAAFADHDHDHDDDTNDVAVVLDANGVVLGLLRRETLGLPPDTLVADALQPGPSTFRPSMTIAELVEYFRSSDETRAIVSTASGRWIGLIRREDVLDA